MDSYRESVFCDPPKKSKSSKPANAWVNYVKAVRKANPDLSYKQAMVLASSIRKKHPGASYAELCALG